MRRKSTDKKINKKQKIKRTPPQEAAALKTAADQERMYENRERAKAKRKMEDKKSLSAFAGPYALRRKEMRAREQRAREQRQKEMWRVSSTGASLPERMSAALTAAVEKERQDQEGEVMDMAVDEELSAVCVELHENQRCYMELAHSTLTHLHPTPRCIVLRQVLDMLDQFADGLPAGTSLGDILSEVIGQSHKFLDFVHKNSNDMTKMKQLAKLGGYGGFDREDELFLLHHDRSTGTQSQWEEDVLPTEVVEGTSRNYLVYLMRSIYLMRTPHSNEFWEGVFAGWQKESARWQKWLDNKKRKREEGGPAEPAKQQPKQTPKVKGPVSRPAVPFGDKIVAASPPLGTLGGLIRACYVIDNMLQLHHQSIAPELADWWFTWRSQRYSSAELRPMLHQTLASVLDVRVVPPELLLSPPVRLYKFLSDQGWHFKPYSIVFATNCRYGHMPELLGGGPQITSGDGPHSRLIATVLSDGFHFAIYLGLTTRFISRAAFAHAKGPAAALVRAKIEDDDLGVITWHASCRIGWGVGSCGGCIPELQAANNARTQQKCANNARTQHKCAPRPPVSGSGGDDGDGNGDDDGDHSDGDDDGDHSDGDDSDGDGFTAVAMMFHQKAQAAMGTESEEYGCLMNALDAFDSEQQGLEATMEVLRGCVERHPILRPQFRLMEQLGAAWRDA